MFQTLAGLSDQDSYYDMVDGLEEQGIEALGHRHVSRKGTDLDLVEQFNIYEVREPSSAEHVVYIRGQGTARKPAMKAQTHSGAGFSILPSA